LTGSVDLLHQKIISRETDSIAHETLRLIERCFLATNLAILALSFSLLVVFWLGKVTLVSLAGVGLPIIAILGWFFVIKSHLLRWKFHKSGNTLVHLIILMFFLAGGLYLRYPTGACIHGGQDHGSYFNIAAWIAEHGTYERHDQLLADAFDQNWPFASVLLENPYKSKGFQQGFIPGEYEGERLTGGFTIKDRKKGHVIPQFYPLTPLLLTTSYWIFGARQTSDILPIFGVLAALAAALLTFRIWKSLFVTTIVLLTLLVSGLEVFFSGFPVSEIISQYFIISGLWLLFWGMENGRSSPSLLAGLNFTAALFNHVSIIFYLGPLVGFFCLYWLASQDNRLNKPVFVFYYIFLAGSTLSLISARTYNGFYVYRNLKESLTFFESLGINGTFILFFAAILLAAVAPLIIHTPFFRRLKGHPLWARNSLLFVIGSIATLILIKTLIYEFNTSYFGEIKYTYFSSITTHISIFGWGFLLLGIFRAIFSSRSDLIALPVLTLAFSCFIFLFQAFSTEYQWYYSRYYVKELYPLAIIFIAFGIYQLSQLSMLRGLKGRLITGVFAFLLIVYSAYPTLRLFNKPFLKGAYSHMVSLTSHLSKNSIIFLVTGPDDQNTFRDSAHRLSVPLAYSFGHDVIRLPFSPNLGKIIEFISRYLRVYQRPIYLIYFSARPLPGYLLPLGAKLITSQTLTFARPERAYHIPKNYGTFHLAPHLYAL